MVREVEEKELYNEVKVRHNQAQICMKCKKESICFFVVGNITLIKLIMSTIPLYYLSIFYLTMGVEKEIRII